MFIVTYHIEQNRTENLLYIVHHLQYIIFTHIYLYELHHNKREKENIYTKWLYKTRLNVSISNQNIRRINNLARVIKYSFKNLGFYFNKIYIYVDDRQ